jgi:hypothetical protein
LSRPMTECGSNSKAHLAEARAARPTCSLFVQTTRA